MQFKSSVERLREEQAYRQGLHQKLCSFGNTFLDDALRGILPTDLVLVGAKTGVGKTQFCVNVAMANLVLGKKIHFIALEAEPNEIEMRLKYQMVSNWHYSKPRHERTHLNGLKLNYLDWYLGRYEEPLKPCYEAINALYEAFSGLFTMYRSKTFDAVDLTTAIAEISGSTDLIILDHVHYIDYDQERENQALKQIAKEAKELTLITQKPIILVAHLRKTDKRTAGIFPELDDFHGSSDLVKASSKTILLAPGQSLGDGRYETYVQAAKVRADGSVTRYIAKSIFNNDTQTYEDNYVLGKLSLDRKEFKNLELKEIPYWARKEIVTVP
jgi:hypothetical protein